MTAGSTLLGRRAEGSGRPGGAAVALLVGVALAVTVGYLVLGTGYVLDDWYILGNARVDGAWGAAGDGNRVARPGAWVVAAGLYGVVGHAPAVVVLVLGATSAATAVLLARLLSWFVPVRVAVACALVWLVLPNHVSLEVWAAAANIALAVALAVGAMVVLVERPWPSGPVLAAVLAAAGGLCYEAVLPVALLAAVALPWLRDGRPAWRSSAVAAAGPVAVAVRSAFTRDPVKQLQDVPDLTRALDGHFGWGIVPEGPAADLALLVALGGVVASLVLVGRRDRPAPRAAWLVVAGGVVVVVGLVPFVRYFYSPLGFGDRAHCVSAVGGAMVWTGIGWLAWAVRRELAVVGAAALALGALVLRVEVMDRWSRAGHDGDAIAAALERQVPEPPDGPVVLGPEPVVEAGVAVLWDPSNAAGMARWVYGERVDTVLTTSEEEFERYPEAVRVDLRAVSTLEP